MPSRTSTLTGGEPFTGEAFDQMLWDYDAVLDSPACFFVEELIAAYPEAKVILTTRTPESWLKSMQNTLLEVITWRSWTLLAFLDGDYSAPYWKLFNSIMRVFSTENPVSQHAYQPSVPGLLQYFDDHHSRVRQAVPKERLLEYHPSHGWEPLCSFLGVPVPEGEFPRENDSKSFVRIHRQIYWSRWLCVARKMAATVGAGSLVAMAAWWWRR